MLRPPTCLAGPPFEKSSWRSALRRAATRASTDGAPPGNRVTTITRQHRNVSISPPPPSSPPQPELAKSAGAVRSDDEPNERRMSLGGFRALPNWVDRVDPVLVWQEMGDLKGDVCISQRRVGLRSEGERARAASRGVEVRDDNLTISKSITHHLKLPGNGEPGHVLVTCELDAVAQVVIGTQRTVDLTTNHGDACVVVWLDVAEALSEDDHIVAAHSGLDPSTLRAGDVLQSGTR